MHLLHLIATALADLFDLSPQPYRRPTERELRAITAARLRSHWRRVGAYAWRAMERVEAEVAEREGR